jgi:hypothetical protein
MSKSRRTPKPPSGTDSTPIDSVDVLLRLLVPALLVARLLVPAEASVLGDTLGLVQLWLAAGALWAWGCFRTRAFSLCAGWLDAALWLVIAGHGASTAWVFVGGGDRRTALNLLWEWIALGVSFFLMRQLVATRADARRLLFVLSAMVVALAGLGTWQHYAALPKTAAQYERLREREQQSPGDPEVRRELARMGVPQNPASRSLWEERLRSTEPFGTMALANTLAGLLTAWLIVVIGAVVRGWLQTPSWTGRIAATLAVALLALCLVLTKSRTALVGTVTGLAVWGGYSLVGAGRSRRWIGWSLAAVAFGGLVIAAAALTGGLDREVLSESPKSLRYRVQYWSGTAAVLRERPLLGTGPGNFRQHYLKHKLPESSEEILDPHNFLLDLWTSGGLIALIGFLLLLVAAGKTFAARGQPFHSPPAEPTDRISDLFRTPAGVGGLIGFALIAVPQLALGDFDERLIGLAVLWLVAFVALGRLFVGGDGPSVSAIVAASLGLLVHLLGAGGIEMPAITQTLLVLLVAGSVLAGPESSGWRQSGLVAAAVGLGSLALFAACLFTATIPVLNRESLVSAADAAYSQDRNLGRAEKLYLEAAETDPLSPAPPERLSDLEFMRWARSAGQPDEAFERGVEFAHEAIRRDPFSANGYRRLGVWYFERHRRTGDREPAVRAVESLLAAVERYPNSAILRAELAQALAAAGQAKSAQNEARTALSLDAVNHREGHRDKYLSDEIIDALRQIQREDSLETGFRTD